MARGGKREGAGRPVGTKTGRTVEYKTISISALPEEVEIIKEVLRVDGVDSNFINRLEDWQVRATQTSGDDFGKVGMI